MGNSQGAIIADGEERWGESQKIRIEGADYKGPRGHYEDLSEQTWQGMEWGRDLTYNT